MQKTQTLRLHLPEPLPHQTTVLRHPARFKVIAGGRRWGKSLAGLVAVLQGHGSSDKRFPGAIYGKTIMWCAPTFPLSTIIWRHLKNATYEITSEISEVDRKIVLCSGGMVIIRSLDNPDSVRGWGLDGVVIDEAAFVKKEAWTEALRPALSDREGWAIFISTPKGKNWFYDLFLQAQQQDDWAAWQRPTSDNPYINKDELDQARIELGSQVFMQEYEASFEALGHGKFQRQWFEVVDEIPFKDAPSIRGWDLAATKPKANKQHDPDWTVGLKMVRGWDGIYYITGLTRVRTTPNEVEQLIKQAAIIDGKKVPIRIEEEPGSGTKNYISLLKKYTLQNYIIKGYPSKDRRDKVTHAQPFAAACERGEVKLLRANWNEAFLDELVSFPSGTHDDQVDAAAMCYHILKTKKPSQPIEIKRIQTPQHKRIDQYQSPGRFKRTISRTWQKPQPDDWDEYESF